MNDYTYIWHKCSILKNDVTLKFSCGQISVMVDICNNLILYTMYCLFCDMFCSLMYASSGLINKEFEFEFEFK